jgi:hypothetical protein|tara:strand:+ start:600 stop:836 length:237 start_codon:yes stop_codon:yes gene_type:complete
MNQFNKTIIQLKELKKERTTLKLDIDKKNKILNRWGFMPMTNSERWERIKERNVLINKINAVELKITRLTESKWSLFK